MRIMVHWNHMKIKGDISVYSLFKKLRIGFQLLSHIEWVSAYGSPISMASLLGIVGFLLAMRDGRIRNFNSLLSLSERSTSSEKQHFVPGLRNLGNNCFLNVVLQSLASCLSFQDFMEEVKDVQSLSTVERVEDLPLLASLGALLEELSTLQDRSMTLNPQKVMSAMHQYIPQFQLANQQDAAEAFLHLLSCLREELSESYMPCCGSLADAVAPSKRILSLKRINDINNPERWWQQYLGPFDGILGSFLSCRSCSSEIMMDFGFFHTLPLPLMVNTGASVMDRFTLEDCIQRFLAPEHIENYSCSHCWHISAIKYLSSFEEQQEKIRKLSCCSEQDYCECRNISSLQALPWSKLRSNAFKQLSIAHCPQILCLHLQRTSVNMFGELVKHNVLQTLADVLFIEIDSHISFPLILNLSPFVKNDVGIQRREVNKFMNLAEYHYTTSISHLRRIGICSDPGKVKDDASQTSSDPLTETWSDNNFMQNQTHDIDKVSTYEPVPSKNHLYRLVSVVEHFGRGGGGHYTVYRGVRSRMKEGDGFGEFDIPPMQWFRISDSDVRHASEDDVLGAYASLLFYERI